MFDFDLAYLLTCANYFIFIAILNENDKNIVLASLRNMNVIVTKENRRINSVPSLEVKNIMKANGVKYE